MFSKLSGFPRRGLPLYSSKITRAWLEMAGDGRRCGELIRHDVVRRAIYYGGDIVDHPRLQSVSHSYAFNMLE